MKPYGCLIVLGAILGLIVTGWAVQHSKPERGKKNSPKIEKLTENRT